MMSTSQEAETSSESKVIDVRKFSTVQVLY